ncbi:MAG: flagellin, partial [Balneolaceae bacterium]
LLNGDTTDNGTATNSGSLGLTFQVGEREEDTITTEISAVNIGELFENASGTTQLGATDGTIVVDAASTGAGNQGSLTFTDAGAEDYRSFIGAVDTAIESMNDRVNEIGMTQSSLSIREVTLSQSVSANSSASSRIMDADFAKEQSESVRLQILQQTSTSALAQANNGPQSVLGFLG